MSKDAPIELIQLGLAHSEFKKARENEYHGPCPWCGGEDRFRIHTEHIFPKWNWECRQCGRKGWADQLNESLRQPITEAERSRLKAINDERDRTRAADVQRRLKEITTVELWAELHRRMADEQRQWWRKQGIPDIWQDYLELGYTAEYPSKEFKSEAYTLPYFHHSETGKQFKTIQYRLTNPPNTGDRYRFSYGLPATYYNADPYEPIGDKVIICEGAKKAIVTAELMHVNHSVLAYPSLSTMGSVTEAVKDCGYIRIIPDPDGYEQAIQFAHKHLPQAKVVRTFSKIDDAINLYGMKAIDLLAAMRQAA